ncbi:hypothetical protein BCV72DRAFT_210335, partial [Rhizopus microsporus var. microsporus]
YSHISNARLHINKAEILFLNDRSQPERTYFLQQHQITKWQDNLSPESLRHLSFPLVQSIVQLRYLKDHLLQIVRSQCATYSQHLSP